jgi:magnesium-transporting ATPase (P-type)
MKPFSSILLVVIMLYFLGFLPGCAAGMGCQGESKSWSRERTKVTSPDGAKVEQDIEKKSEAKTPSNPVEPASTDLGDKGPKGSSGKTSEKDQALEMISWMPIAGVALIAFGVFTLVGKFWLPFLAALPLGASWGFIAFGAGLTVIPILLDRYSLAFLLSGLALTALFVTWVVGGLDNVKNLLLNKEKK